MSRWTVLALIVGLGISLVATGCGDSLGSSLPDNPSVEPDPGGSLPDGMAAFSLRIAWPQPAAQAELIPTGTTRITIEVYDGEGQTPETSVTLTRKDVRNGEATAKLLVHASPLKTVAVGAWDAAGQLVSYASQELTVLQGQVTQLALELLPTGITGPVVTATATPAAALVGEPVTLSATATDPDGIIALYEWDLTSDGVFDVASSGATTATAPALPAGDYEALLRVTDNDGIATQTSVAYRYSNPIPPSWQSVPASIKVPVGGSSDPVTLTFAQGLPLSDCTVTVAPATAVWTQTDSTATSVTGTFAASDADFAGTIDVTLTLTDGLSRTDTATTTLDVRRGREWTWMVFAGAANNLEAMAALDVNEMEAAQIPSDVMQVVALVDTTTGYDSYAGWDGHAYRYEIAHDSDTTRITSPNTDMGVLDSGDPAVLKSFVDWCVANYPANRYGVIFWDHGSGFKGEGTRDPMKGVCWDDDSGNNLDIGELTGALSGIPSGQLEIVAMDACLMGMAEVAYEFEGVAGYYVGSEENVPGTGYDYEDAFTRVVTDASQSGSRVASDLVDSYAAEYGAGGWGDETLSAIDLTKIGDLASAADDFASAAIGSWSGATPGEWSSLIAQVTAFGDPEFLDMHHLGSRGVSALSDAALSTAIGRFRNAVSAAVVAHWEGTSYPDARGLSLWVPASGSGGMMPKYREMKWTADTRWDEFLAVAAP